MEKLRVIYFALAHLMLFSFALPASAHEAYTLPSNAFQKGLKITSLHPFAPLIDAAHIKIFFFVGILIILSYVSITLLSTTTLARRVDTIIRKAQVAGPLIIRLAVSLSLFSSAQYNVIFGPELSLAGIPLALVARFLLFLASIMIFFGFFTEMGAAIGIVLFVYAGTHFGPYIITYTNYLGELIALLLFGNRVLSFDKLLFKNKRWIGFLDRAWETPIVRILYGVALIYAGYTIKFLHQGLSIDVYNQYHLQNFFHASASFIAAGAGASEILIGILLLIGFAMRWTIFISLAFITLSILYFQELLWPHLLLYGISFSLFINAGDFLTLENRFLPWLKKRKE